MYKTLERLIEDNNFESILEMRNKIDIFFAVDPARINADEYTQLNDKLNEKENKIKKSTELK